MWLELTGPEVRGGECCPGLMRAELTLALQEALFELDVLPGDEEGALVGVYAVIDDLQHAIQRAEELDGKPVG